ncbi:MAG: hypothetical protein J7539_06985 [Niabella sp.]|nr:hypothetical protein [Niabella sp.]
MQKKFVFFSLIWTLLSLQSQGQFTKLISKLEQNNTNNLNAPREKLFIHYDRPFYKVKDTMWLKGYLLSASENSITDSTGIAYIEIINAANEVVKRTAAPCYWGRFQSSIALAEDDFPQGSYLLRAYTNWMRNFGDSTFFESHFTIINPVSGDWNARIEQLSLTGNRIILDASLTANNLQPIARKKIGIRVRSKNHALLKLQAITDAEGNLFIDTLLKNDATGKSLMVEISDKEDLKLQVPVISAGASAIDLQFLPEGGSLVAGKERLIGFKALNNYGKGIDTKGVIKGPQGKEVARFVSIHKGMGTVAFTPQAGEQYTAYPEQGQPVKLPEVKASGTTLHVSNSEGADSVNVSIDGSADLWGSRFFFSATSKGINLAAGPVRITPKAHTLGISKKVLPSGITTFTLYDSLMRPVNERSVFIWHKDPLQLSLVSNKDAYRKKDSVSLQLTVKDLLNKNNGGSFSIAVIDTSQVAINKLSENLLTYMLLSADLKGIVEDPYYYFQDPAPGAADALLLTQGWVHYEWQPAAFKYDRESTYKITGKATNIFNKPFSNTKVTLFGKTGKNEGIVMDTTTDKNGIFTFSHFPYFTSDSVSLAIEAVNKKGKAFNVGVELNEPKFPPYTGGAAVFDHQNILLDTATAQFVTKQTAMRKLIKKNGEYLDEVVVKTNALIPGSKNLNKNGGADQVINEKILQKTPKATLLDVLNKQVKGFRMGSPPKSNTLMYMVNTNIARFIIDGVDLHFFYHSTGIGINDYILFLNSYLQYFSAEDIKGIEVMNNPRFNSNYRSRFLSTQEQINSGPVRTDYSFIEITTQSGSGPFLRKTPGMYLYRPVVPVLAKQFYSPRYSSPDVRTVLPDLRATVYWNPEVIVSRNGEAHISFYTSESNSNYMILVQGINLVGGMGVLYQPLIVNKK